MKHEKIIITKRKFSNKIVFSNKIIAIFVKIRINGCKSEFFFKNGAKMARINRVFQIKFVTYLFFSLHKTIKILIIRFLIIVIFKNKNTLD